MYAATFIIFALNFNKPASQLQEISDEEMLSDAGDNNIDATAAQSISPITLLTPAFMQPLRVDTLPKDFEPRPQTQQHYLTPEQAAAAGIEPPTPVLRAQQAERETQVEKGIVSFNIMLARPPSDIGRK